jgi:capsular exopolysaccharide synthesis family protein
MSYIFDALQRAEAERDGTRSTGATELLQRAEREAAAQRRSARTSRPAAPLKTARTHLPPHQGLILEAQENAAAAASMAQDSDTDASMAGAAILDAFGSLDVSLPKDSRLVCLTDKESAAAEGFRLLGVRLRHMRRERPLQKLLITSTIPQEGKSMVSANLACTLAAGSDRPVLLLEGDIRRPSLMPLLRLPATPGLCDWLQGRRDLTECIWRLQEPGFWILPAGVAPDDPLDLMQPARMAELIDQLSTWFSWVIIDSPPVLPMADTSVWARLSDGILLVSRRGITRRRHLLRGLQAIDQNKLIGAVMNSATNASDRDYYYYRRKASTAQAADSVK